MRKYWNSLLRCLYFYNLTNTIWEHAKYHYEIRRDLEKTEYYVRYYKRLQKLIKK